MVDRYDWDRDGALEKIEDGDYVLFDDHAAALRAAQVKAWDEAVRTVQELCRGGNLTGEAAASALIHGLGAGNPYREGGGE